MRTKCYSVRLESLIKITPKAYKAVAYDGSEAVIPASQVMGRDWDVASSEAYWIAAWVLEKSRLQYSGKKEAWFDENRRQLPTYTVQRHRPERMQPLEDNSVKELER